MQTLKTALVVTFLLAVLYGVYVTLNKPDPAGDANSLEGPQEWSEPSVELSTLSADASSVMPGNAGPASPNAPAYARNESSNFPLPSFDSAGGAPDPAPRAAVADPYANEVDAPPLARPWQHVADGSHEHAGAGESGSYVPSAELNRAAPRNAATDFGNDAASAYSPRGSGGNESSPYENSRNSAPLENDSAMGEDDAPAPYRPYEAVGGASEQDNAASRTSLAEYKFKEGWAAAQQYLDENKFARALAALTELYRETDLTVEHRQQLLDMLDRLAGTVIYSTEHRLEQPYEVARGETLEQIAEQFRVPSELLFNINRGSISEPDLLLPGTQLKVMRGPFRAEITINADDPAHGEATLFLGSLYAGRFPVNFGDDVPTPGRTYQVTERLEGKPFYDPSGPPVPARSPNNPYGLYWLGLNDPEIGIHSLGRHGGEDDRRGSIRLEERDAADVFGILSIGSIVKVLQ